MLGRAVAELFSLERGNSVHVISRNSPQKDDSLYQSNSSVQHHALDVTDALSFASYLRKARPTIVVYCAACTDVDKCEIEKEMAFALHSEALDTIACCIPQTRLIYISTDAVFDGTEGDYREFDNPRPLNQYALSKRAGELKTLELFANGLVIRTNIFGNHTYPATSLAEWALSKFKLNEPINGFYDVFFNPVYTKQLARLILELDCINLRGIIHVSSDVYISKHEFLKNLASSFGYDTKLIEEKSICSVKFKAERPRIITLNNNLLKTKIGYIPLLADGLAQFHSDYTQTVNATK